MSEGESKSETDYLVQKQKEINNQPESNLERAKILLRKRIATFPIYDNSDNSDNNLKSIRMLKEENKYLYFDGEHMRICPALVCPFKDYYNDSVA